MEGKYAMLRKQVLIGFTALGIAFGSGAAAAMPIGLQSLPSNPMIQENGATVEPVHFRGRRKFVRHHFVHPRKFHRRHFVRRHHFAPRHHFVRRHHFVPRHHFARRHHFRSRPHFSFGLSFGHW
jgi:hypothetical protein